MKKKFCTKCKTDKPVSEFRIINKIKPRLQCHCRECERTVAIDRYYELTQAKRPEKLVSLDGEFWRDINDCQGLYQISNFGRVIRVHEKLIGKIIKPKLGTNGYYGLQLTKNNIQKDFTIHRLVAIAFIPNPNNLPQVNHVDGNKKNNNLSNLEWVTASGNKIHALGLGLINIPKGENHHNSKLTNKQVEEIRRKYKPLIYTQLMLAKEYGVCGSNISIIVNNKRWAHL